MEGPLVMGEPFVMGEPLLMEEPLLMLMSSVDDPGASPGGVAMGSVFILCVCACVWMYIKVQGTHPHIHFHKVIHAPHQLLHQRVLRILEGSFSPTSSMSIPEIVPQKYPVHNWSNRCVV